MKKFIYFIFICALSVGFVGCGDKDEDEDKLRADPNFNPVLGEWFGGGSKINEKYIFTVDFICQKYERDDQFSGWVFVSEFGYLINSTYIKIGSNDPIQFGLRNYVNYQYQELDLRLEENKFFVYYKNPV